MDQQTLSTVKDIALLILFGYVLFDVGRRRGAAGLKQGLDTINGDPNMLNAIEGVVQSVPGTVLENVIREVIKGFIAIRPFIPSEELKQIGDVAVQIGDKVSDGLPNDQPSLAEGGTSASGNFTVTSVLYTPPAKDTPDAPEPEGKA